MIWVEKCNFKFYVSCYQGDVIFVQFFDFFNQMDIYDDKAIFDVLFIFFCNFFNYKCYFYQQFFKSFCLFYIKCDIEIFIYEQIDFVCIFYSKGMYMQALCIFESVKNKAEVYYQDVFYFEIIEFQKFIEVCYIICSCCVVNKMEGFFEEVSYCSCIVYFSNFFFNFNI